MIYTANNLPLLVCLLYMFVCAISDQFTCMLLLASTFCTFVSRPGGRTQRAEPWQLRQENSDAVWNELAYLKNLNRKLCTEK